MRRRCGAGCYQKGYGVGRGSGVSTASDENGKSMWGNWRRWMEAFTTSRPSNSVSREKRTFAHHFRQGEEALQDAQVKSVEIP
jgi:hypothetical protein